MLSRGASFAPVAGRRKMKRDMPMNDWPTVIGITTDKVARETTMKHGQQTD
jgi:hypothetical protein